MTLEGLSHGAEPTVATDHSSAWERVSQDFNIKERLSGDSADIKIARVAYAVGEGLYGGATKEVANIVEHPLDALKGIGIGVAATAALALGGARGGFLLKALPMVFTATAALDVLPHAGALKSGLQDAWRSNANLDLDAAKLAPLGTMAVDYGLASLTFRTARSGLRSWADHYVQGSYSSSLPHSRAFDLKGLANDVSDPALLAEIRSASKFEVKGPIGAKVGSLKIDGLPLAPPLARA